MILELIGSLGDWTWWIVAAVLFVFELIVPGIFFLWLGFAAVAVALIDLFLDLSWQAEVAIFAVLSVISLIASRIFMRGREIATDSPNLNKRMLNHVGRTFVLDAPIVNGGGKIRIDDTIWEVRGKDAAAGSWVRLTGVDGSVYLSEPAEGPS